MSDAVNNVQVGSKIAASTIEVVTNFIANVIMSIGIEEIVFFFLICAAIFLWWQTTTPKQNIVSKF